MYRISERERNLRTLCLVEPPPGEEMAYPNLPARLVTGVRMAPPYDQAGEGWLGPELLLTTRQALTGFLLSTKHVRNKGGTRDAVAV